MSALVSETKKISEDLEQGVITHDVEMPMSGAQTTGAYPRGGLQARDPRDELYAEKMQFMKDNNVKNGMTPFGLVQASDKDFEWLRKKRETEAFAQLDAWIGRNFHTPSVAQRKWLQETYPEYYEARERLMVDRAKLALRIKLLKLRGPKSQKDLILQWGLQTGRIKLDENWDRVGFYEEPGKVNLAAQQKRFKDGLFSFRRYLSEEERLTNAQTPGNPFEPGTLGQDEFQQDTGGLPGAFVPTKNRFPSFLQNVVSPYVV